MLIKHVVCGVTLCAMGLTTVCFYDYQKDDKDYLQNKQYQDQVALELDADMLIMKKFDSIKKRNRYDLARLKPNKSGKIYVCVEDNLSDKIKNNINTTLNDFNKAFSIINDSYNFVTCSKEEYIKQRDAKNSSIKIEYGNVSPDTALAVTGDFAPFKRIVRGDAPENAYMVGAKIYLNQSVFNSLSDQTQLFALKHEILHTLGFDDTYKGYSDETSLMNVRYIGFVNRLGPNDLKMLYVAYGNKHINKDGSFNQEKMNEVKEKIKEYEKEYYNNLVKALTVETGREFEDIDPSKIENAQFTNDGAQITIQNGKFNYVKGDYQKSGDVIIGKNYVILPNILIDNSNDFLILLKQECFIDCYNMHIYHSESDTMIDSAAQDIDIILQ